MHRPIAPLALALALAVAACSKSKDSAPPAADPAPPPAEAAKPDPHAAPPHAADPHGNLPQGVPPHGGGMGQGGPAAAVKDGRLEHGPISVEVPDGWESQATRSSMRAAQFRVPGPGGDAELVVFYFGAGGAGGVEPNLDRWYSQFEQEDGRPTREVAKRETRQVAGVEVTTVDVGGRFVAQVTPGSAERHDQAGSRMLAAIFDTSAGPYYFKMVGPEATVAAAVEPFDAMIASLELR